MELFYPVKKSIEVFHAPPVIPGDKSEEDEQRDEDPVDGLARGPEVLAAVPAVKFLAVHGPGAFIALLAARAGEFERGRRGGLDDFHFLAPFSFKLASGKRRVGKTLFLRRPS